MLHLNTESTYQDIGSHKFCEVDCSYSPYEIHNAYPVPKVLAAYPKYGSSHLRYHLQTISHPNDTK
jgi:hypothetical protein